MLSLVGQMFISREFGAFKLDYEGPSPLSVFFDVLPADMISSLPVLASRIS